MELKTEIMNIENQKRAQRADLEALPNLPLKKFHEFLFKYALLESAQKGYDEIYWTTGEMQADRYGRDAERESGMKGFYDKIVGDYANKLGKRYGVKADVVTLKAPQSWRGNAEFNHLTITPEMRQDMLQQGLPRYKLVTEEVTQQFNRSLAEYDPLKHRNRRLSLGKPGEILRLSGIEDSEIFILGRTLQDKSDTAKHPFEVKDLFNLPEMINDPIFVMDSVSPVPEDSKQAKTILTEIRTKTGNILAVLKTKARGRGIEINQIVSIYPKNDSGVSRWIR